MSRTSRVILSLVGIAVIVSLGLWLLVGDKSHDQASEPMRIGAVLPLTGPAAQIGEWQRNALQLAFDHVNADGGIEGRRLELVVQDSQSLPAAGVSAFQKVLLGNDIPVVFSSLSSVSSAVLSVADEREVSLMMLAVSLPEITERSPWAFRCNLGSDDEARAMVDYLQKGVFVTLCG